MTISFNSAMLTGFLAGAVIIAALWLLSGTLLPFFLGAAIAYLLDPVVERLEHQGVKRLWATIFIALAFVAALALIGLLVLPRLIDQINQLVQTGPQALRDGLGHLRASFPNVMHHGGLFDSAVAKLSENFSTWSDELMKGAFGIASGLINTLLLLLITPVVAFYMLLDWDRMLAWINARLPREHAPTIRRLAGEIDAVLSGFIRGQMLVCAILGSFYAIALMALGLKYAIVIGFVAGALTFIPYIGSAVGFLLSVGVALAQFWGDWLQILMVAGVFFFGQFVEGNILTPKMVGDSVQLHPVWLIAALSVFGTLFGFTGMLVAVPLAAALGVIIRHFADRFIAVDPVVEAREQAHLEAKAAMTGAEPPQS